MLHAETYMNHDQVFGKYFLSPSYSKNNSFLRGNVISFERSSVVLEVITGSGLNLLWSLQPSPCGAAFTGAGWCDVMFEGRSVPGGSAYRVCAMRGWRQAVCMTCAPVWRWFSLWCFLLCFSHWGWERLTWILHHLSDNRKFSSSVNSAVASATYTATPNAHPAQMHGLNKLQ